jgi:murein DD-endopeptidase MepM/ murein hydrolase activator NlpD
MGITAPERRLAATIFAPHMREYFFLFICVLGMTSFAQAPHPPMDLPPLLSGTFGELRSNHFHAGIDIKTEGREGQPVRAVWDGYISRIKVSPYGYGNALYVSHSNGKTTVYGHLQRFSTRIQQYVRELQYQRESFELDVQVSPSRLPVKQDELIGLSGNSGGSGGPHLHFEIRDSRTQHALNPLLEGIDKFDNIAPTIVGVRLVELDRHLDVQNESGISSNATLRVPSRVGIEVNTFDQLNGANNHNGVFSIELYVDSQVTYRFAVDELSFAEKRYINAHANYAERACCRNWWQRMYKLPGNRLRNVDARVNDGILELDSGQQVSVTLVVNDVAGNKSERSFQLIGTGEEVESTKGEWISHRLDHSIEFEGLRAYLSKGVLYKDERLRYRTEDPSSLVYSKIYELLNDSVAAHQTFSLDLPIDSVPARLRSQALVVSVSPSGRISSEGGKVKGNRIVARVRQFGRFAVTVDSIPPHISPINILNNYDLSKSDGIILKASDNLSGIDFYRASIDGKWHLCEYDGKSARFYIPFEERLIKGKHQLRFVVVDGVGNQSEYSASFVH